ncbi:MAG: hypothetical protein OEZ03_11390 [Alphaproteobacteria bacterium]|nr:hypothetical protein [Alphaproteobacteria bacterium]
MTPPGEYILWRNDQATHPTGFGKIRVGIIGAMLLGLAGIWLSPGEAGTVILMATVAWGVAP